MTTETIIDNNPEIVDSIEGSEKVQLETEWVSQQIDKTMIESMTHEQLQIHTNELAQQFLESENKLTQLQTELDKYMRIAATAQTEYRRMYDELQWLRNRATQEKLMTKIELYRKLTPGVFKLISDLKAILSTLTQERADLPVTKSLKLLPQTFDDYLSQNKILSIKTLWEEPDATYHEVLMSREINESDVENLNTALNQELDTAWYSGKIIQELESWYYIIEWEVPYIIKAAKVVVWV